MVSAIQVKAKHVGALAAFSLLNYTVPWPVSVIVRDHAAMVLRAWEADVGVADIGNEASLGIGSCFVRVDAGCTGVNLIVAVAILGWGARRGLGRYLLYSGIMSLCLYSANILRIAVTTSLNARGWDWGVCHDIPYAAMLLLACLWGIKGPPQ